VTKDAAQRSPSALLRAVSVPNGSWTFYEAINVGGVDMKANRILLVSVSVLMGLALTMGCSSLGGKRKETKEAPAVGQQARYFHFEDILIPQGLKLEMDKSFIYETPSFKAGKLVFSGRLEVRAVIGQFLCQ